MGRGAGDVDLMERLIELLGTVLIESNTRHRRVVQTEEIGLANLRTPEQGGDEERKEMKGRGEKVGRGRAEQKERGGGNKMVTCVCVCVCVCVAHFGASRSKAISSCSHKTRIAFPRCVLGSGERERQGRGGCNLTRGS